MSNTSERPYLEAPQDIELLTRFGAAYITVNDGTHLYVGGKRGSSSGHAMLTVKDVLYYVSFQLTLLNGSWNPTPDRDGRTYDALYILRYDHWTTNLVPTNFTRIKVTEELVRRVNAWAATEEAQRLLRTGQHRALNNSARSLECDICELETKLAACRAELGPILQELGEGKP